MLLNCEPGQTVAGWEIEPDNEVGKNVAFQVKQTLVDSHVYMWPGAGPLNS